MKKLSEYIVKVNYKLNKEICKTLDYAINQGEGFENAIDQSDLDKLIELHNEYYQKYYSDVMPDVDLTEGDSSTYGFELDAINISVKDDTLINLGSKGKTNRYLAFVFIVGPKLKETTMNFHAQKVTNKCNTGDIYIIPSNFTHRFSIDLNENEAFSAILLYNSI